MRIAGVDGMMVIEKVGISQSKSHSKVCFWTSSGDWTLSLAA